VFAAMGAMLPATVMRDFGATSRLLGKKLFSAHLASPLVDDFLRRGLVTQ
jgi:hypothetical protein